MDANTLILLPNGTQADERLTIDATVGGVQLAALHADTTHVLLSFEDAQCRMTLDGSAPTSTNGHLIDPGMWLLLRREAAQAAKWIRTGGTSAVAHASQLKQ